jgi:hypothetical protein
VIIIDLNTRVSNRSATAGHLDFKKKNSCKYYCHIRLLVVFVSFRIFIFLKKRREITQLPLADLYALNAIKLISLETNCLENVK